jgi:hypothetical protein
MQKKREKEKVFITFWQIQVDNLILKERQFVLERQK